jgi:hypothetical protein
MSHFLVVAEMYDAAGSSHQRALEFSAETARDAAARGAAMQIPDGWSLRALRVWPVGDEQAAETFHAQRAPQWILA